MATTRQTGASLGSSVGLTDDDLVEMYRYVALARALDERMWVLNRAGRIPFVISGQGHEGAQVGIAWAFQRGHDWIAPFYRSIATCLTFGMSPRDIMTASWKAANEVYDDTASKNAKFKKIYDNWKPFRDEQNRWFRFAEGSFDNFMQSVSLQPIKKG